MFVWHIYARYARGELRETTDFAPHARFGPRLRYIRQALAGCRTGEGSQPARHTANLTIPRRVAEPPLPVDDRQRVGTALDHGEKGAAQIKHGPGLDEYWGAAFVAAAQKPSQEEVLPTLSALYLALRGYPNSWSGNG